MKDSIDNHLADPSKTMLEDAGSKVQLAAMACFNKINKLNEIVQLQQERLAIQECLVIVQNCKSRADDLEDMVFVKNGEKRQSGDMSTEART